MWHKLGFCDVSNFTATKIIAHDGKDFLVASISKYWGEIKQQWIVSTRAMKLLIVLKVLKWWSMEKSIVGILSLFPVHG